MSDKIHVIADHALDYFLARAPKRISSLELRYLLVHLVSIPARLGEINLAESINHLESRMLYQLRVDEAELSIIEKDLMQHDFLVSKEDLVTEQTTYSFSPTLIKKILEHSVRLSTVFLGDTPCVEKPN